MGCAEEVASVHVEGWNLSCRAYTLNITDQSQKHTHKRPPQICNNKTSCEARYQICEKRDFQLIIISIQVTRGISVYIRTQVFPLTCCRLGDVHLWGLLLLGQEGRHTAKLREAAATAAIARRGQASTLQLLGFHLTDVRGVRGCGGFGTEG